MALRSVGIIAAAAVDGGLVEATSEQRVSFTGVAIDDTGGDATLDAHQIGVTTAVQAGTLQGTREKEGILSGIASPNASIHKAI